MQDWPVKTSGPGITFSAPLWNRFLHAAEAAPSTISLRVFFLFLVVSPLKQPGIFNSNNYRETSAGFFSLSTYRPSGRQDSVMSTLLFPHGASPVPSQRALRACFPTKAAPKGRPCRAEVSGSPLTVTKPRLLVSKTKTGQKRFTIAHSSSSSQ